MSSQAFRDVQKCKDWVDWRLKVAKEEEGENDELEEWGIGNKEDFHYQNIESFIKDIDWEIVTDIGYRSWLKSLSVGDILQIKLHKRIWENRIEEEGKESSSVDVNQQWDPAVGMSDNQRTKTNYKELAAALALLLLFFLGIGAGFVYLRNQSEKSNQNQASVLINQIFEK